MCSDLPLYAVIPVDGLFFNLHYTGKSTFVHLWGHYILKLDHYPDVLENDMKFLADYSSYNKNVDFAGRIVYNEQGVEVFNFGKYKGMPVSEILKKDIGYFGWLMQGDFTLNTKNVLTKIRLRETGLLK